MSPARHSSTCSRFRPARASAYALHLGGFRGARQDLWPARRPRPHRHRAQDDSRRASRPHAVPRRRRHLAEQLHVAASPRARTWSTAWRCLKPDAMTGHWEFTLGAERVKANHREARLSVPGAEHPRHRMERSGVRADGDVRARRRQDRGDRPGLSLHADRQSALDDAELVVRHPRGGLAGQRRQGARRRARSSSCCCRTTASTSTASSPSRVRGIDVILTGHTHDALPVPVTVGKTVLIASGSHGKFVTRARSRRRRRRREGLPLPDSSRCSPT